MSLVSENIGFMQIFARVPLGGGIKWQWGRRRRQFSATSVAISSETLHAGKTVRLSILYGHMLPLVGLKFGAK